MSSYASIDPSYMAQQLTQIDRAPKENQLNSRQKIFDQKLSGVKSLKSALSDFKSKLSEFKKSGSILANSVKSSQEDVATITAKGSTLNGNYQLSVKQLAQNHELTINFGAVSPLPTDGELKIDANGHSLNLDLSTLPASASLSDLASAINNHVDNEHVNASVVRNGADTFLMLSSKEGGANSTITLSHLAGTAGTATTDFANALATQQTISAAQNAEFTLGASGSFVLSRESNTITDVIEGATIELKQAQAPGDAAVQLSVASDQEASKEKVQSFVDEANKIIDLINNNENLKRDSTARSIKNQIRSAFQGSFSGSTLYGMGIEFDRHGKLSIDSSRLDKALTENPQQLTEMLSGTGGLFEKLEDTIKPYEGTLGLLSEKQKTIQSSLDLIADSRKRLDYSMEKTYQRYLAQYTAMQTTIARLESSMGNFNSGA